MNRVELGSLADNSLLACVGELKFRKHRQMIGCVITIVLVCLRALPQYDSPKCQTAIPRSVKQ